VKAISVPGKTLKLQDHHDQAGPRAAFNTTKATHSKPRILRLLIEIPESEAPFQQFSLPKMHQHEITLCTVFKSDSHVPPQMRLFEGDHTVRGFLRALREALRAGPYDIVHAHAPHVGLLFLLLAIWRPSLLKRTVMTVHNCYKDVRFRNRLLLLPSLLLFRRIVCCGQASYDSFPRYIRWLAGRRLEVVVNGVDTDRVDRVLAGSNLKTPLDFTVTAACRLTPIKNLPTALAAFASCTDQSSRMVFMGSGVARDSLVGQARELGVEERVEFTGMLPREDVYRRVAASDLFISASHGEGLPVAALEAMACGCPVLLSDIEPHREIAAGADFIPLVAADDAEGFQREIDNYRRMLPSQRAAIGEQCRQLVKQRFSLNSMLEGYERVFEEVGRS